MEHMTTGFGCEYADYNQTVNDLLKMTCHTGPDVLPQDSNGEETNNVFLVSPNRTYNRQSSQSLSRSQPRQRLPPLFLTLHQSSS